MVMYSWKKITEFSKEMNGKLLRSLQDEDEAASVFNFFQKP